MGLMDMVTQAAGQMGVGGDKAQVASAAMEEINSHGGIGGVFSAFQQNGLGGLVQSWAGGNTEPAAPEQVEQGLGGTGIIDGIVNRTGIQSPIVKSALGFILPMIVHHFTASGAVTPEGEATGKPIPDQGGMLQSILGKLM